jgi:hypothetical protein
MRHRAEARQRAGCGGMAASTLLWHLWEVHTRCFGASNGVWGVFNPHRVNATGAPYAANRSLIEAPVPSIEEDSIHRNIYYGGVL